MNWFYGECSTFLAVFQLVQLIYLVYTVGARYLYNSTARRRAIIWCILCACACRLLRRRRTPKWVLPNFSATGRNLIKLQLPNPVRVRNNKIPEACFIYNRLERSVVHLCMLLSKHSKCVGLCVSATLYIIHCTRLSLVWKISDAQRPRGYRNFSNTFPRLHGPSHCTSSFFTPCVNQQPPYFLVSLYGPHPVNGQKVTQTLEIILEVAEGPRSVEDRGVF